MREKSAIMKSMSFLSGFLLTGFLFAISTPLVVAQEPPPRPVTATAIQNLSFGVFYQGAAGGTVTINYDGTRVAGGTVVLLGTGTYTAAIFDVNANPGTVISFLKPVTNLSDGSGHFLSLQIDSTNPSTPFVTTNPYTVPTQIYIGGILTIGTPLANPPGNYTGTFEIIFIQE